jgi:FAD-dependent urate hydroxylase
VIAQDTDVVIVGAGPYGLSLAAHLEARGVSHRIFGQPMTFWRAMPVGVNLKSLAFATNVYVPAKGHTFPEWCRRQGLEDFEPCTMQSFADYGMEMQRRFVPQVEPTEVTRVSASAPRGFEVTLADGRRVRARRVVCATGLSHFARVPEALRGLPPELALHTFFLSDYSRFSGKEVAVVGAGASAVEAGALVREAGGASQVLARAPEAVFHGRTLRTRPLLERVREPMTVLGGGRMSWVLQEFPLFPHLLPENRRIRFVRGYLGPASPWWIKDRVIGKVPLHVNCEVIAAMPRGGRVELTVGRKGGADWKLEVDFVIAGTGYDIDTRRIGYLDEALLPRIARTAGAPALSIDFESSVRGLYFVGPVSSMSFGPLVRFVAGAEFTVRRLARHLAGPLGVRSLARRGAALLSRGA